MRRAVAKHPASHVPTVPIHRFSTGVERTLARAHAHARPGAPNEEIEQNGCGKVVDKVVEMWRKLWIKKSFPQVRDCG
jgi:hypothetical protein